MAAERGGGRGRRGRGRGASVPTITWPGSFGPTKYEPPLEQLPLEERTYFRPPIHLRPYDDRKDEWPLCHHGTPCVVQMYDGWGDGGRRFFRCPYGLVSIVLYLLLPPTMIPTNYSQYLQNYHDEGNCRFTKWIDPPIHNHTQEYIHCLLCKIQDLEERVRSLEADADANP